MNFKILFLGFIFLSCLNVYAQNDKRNLSQLTIYFETPENTEGKIYFLVFDNQNDFGNQEKAYNSGIVNPPSVTLSLPYGKYAITCFQDTKGAGKLTTNLLGIPNEPIGSSNNPKLKGNPKWNDADFSVTQPKQEITIKLKKIF